VKVGRSTSARKAKAVSVRLAVVAPLSSSHQGGVLTHLPTYLPLCYLQYLHIPIFCYIQANFQLSEHPVEVSNGSVASMFEQRVLRQW
jgi:hypothetical protein